MAAAALVDRARGAGGIGGGSRPDLVVIRLRAPGQHVGDVQPRRTVAELGDHAAVVGRNRDGERARADEDLVMSVAVTVFARPRDLGHGARVDQRSLRFQERALHGPAQMRQIAAAEHAVPVRVVGLSAPERGLAPAEPRVVGAAAEGRVKSPREAQHLPVGIRDLGVLDEEGAPEAAAEQARQALAVGEAADFLAGPASVRAVSTGSAHSPISRYDAVGR